MCFFVMAPSSAFAQPADAEIGNSEFFVLFPELRTLPAPEVLEPRLRVSYSTLSGGGGSGAGGVLQYDIVAMGATTIVASQAGYGDIGAGVIPLGQGVALGVPGLGPFWMHPTVLANAEAAASEALTVTRYDKDVAGSMREVVRFQTNTSDGGRVVDEFSAASGLLVFSSIGTTESGSQVTLLSARTVNLPWPADAAPNWARPGARLEYTGVKSSAIPGAGVTEQPASATISVERATAGWTMFSQSLVIGGVDGGTAQIVSGINQLHGAVWLPTAAVTAVLPTTPMLVDEDGVTGAQTFVVADAASIKVQQELTGAIVSWTYDRTFGVLEEQRVSQQGPVADEETVLTRSGGSDLAELVSGPVLPDDAPVVTDPNNQPPKNNDDGATPTDGGDGGAGEPSIRVTDDDESGCATARGEDGGMVLFVGLIVWGIRRRNRRAPG